MEAKEKEDKKAYISGQVMLCALMILNAVHSAYVINYTPKIGAFHITLCTVFGIILIIYSIWAVVKCISMLIKKEGKNGFIIVLLILTVFLAVMGVPSVIPYGIDFLGESKTVTTDEYLVVRDYLYFRDDDGNDVALLIPEDMAKEFRSKENYEYDPEKNLLKYHDKITVTYYPNSKVLIQ